MNNLLTHNAVFNAIRNVNAVLDGDQKRKAAIMIALLIFNALSDFVGLATIGTLIFSALENNAFTASMYTRDLAGSDLQYQVGLWLRGMYNWSGASSEMQFLFYLSIVIFFSFIIKNLIGLYIVFIQTRFSFNVALRLNLKMFKYFYDQGYAFIHESTSGKRIYQIVELPSRFAMFYMTKLIELGTDIVVLLIIAVSLFIIEPGAILLILIAIVPTFLAIYLITKTKNEQIGILRNAASPKNYGIIYESMKGYVDIKLANLEQRFLEQYHKSQQRINGYDIWSFGIFQKINQRTNDIIFGLGIMVIFGYAYFTNLDRTLVVTLLGIFAIAAYKFLPSVNRMLTNLLVIKNNNYIFSELKMITGQPLTPFEEVYPLSFNDKISLQNIHFNYQDSELSTLDNFSLDIQKGDFIGIVGSSGSGKTTLLKIFLRLLHEQSGQFKVDDVIITPQNEASYQRIIGYVQQDVFILDNTLAANIALGSDNPDLEKLQRCLEQVELNELVNEHPLGLQMPLGEEGKYISGGQKQRVGIARALYKDASILVFDEITSALDTDTEKSIIRNINKLANTGITIIVVAHRITTLEKCNKIYKMENGKIIKKMVYSELLGESILSA